MSTSTVSLGMLKAFGTVDVDAFCADCGQQLGRYFYGPNLDGVWTLAERSAHERLDPTTIVRPFFRGPRTQPGLYTETFGAKLYLRKKCVCPANEKRTFGAIGKLPVTVTDGTVKLVF